MDLSVTNDDLSWVSSYAFVDSSANNIAYLCAKGVLSRLVQHVLCSVVVAGRAKLVAAGWSIATMLMCQ